MEETAGEVEEGDKEVKDRVLEDLVPGTQVEGPLGSSEVGKGSVADTGVYGNPQGLREDPVGFGPGESRRAGAGYLREGRNGG